MVQKGDGEAGNRRVCEDGEEQVQYQKYFRDKDKQGRTE